MKAPAGRLATAAVALLLVLVGCGGASAQSSGSGQTASGGTLTVFAAASLTDAFGELAQEYERRHGGQVRVSFAGSSTLATQILHGAPAEVYAPADQAQMTRVERAGLLAYGPKAFAKNRLVALVPEDNPAGVGTFRDLAEPGIRLVLAAEEVPVAEYAEQLLKDANSDYGSGFRRQVLDNLVSREADVRAAVNRVVVGDADATFAYSSDVTPDVREQVKIVEIPPELNVVATYPVGVLTEADDKERARQWIRLLLSDTGRQVLTKWGFQPVQQPG